MYVTLRPPTLDSEKSALESSGQRQIASNGKTEIMASFFKSLFLNVDEVFFNALDFFLFWDNMHFSPVFFLTLNFFDKFLF